MPHTFRAPILPWLGVVVLATLFAPPTHAEPRAGAGAVVYYNGAVFTGQDGAVDGSWFVVRDGRFVDVGRGAGLPIGWNGAETHDLGGRFVAPGFIDAHVHLVDGGLSLIQTDLGLVRTAEELSGALVQADHQRVGGFVVARNLGLEACGGTLPTHDLFHRLLPSPDAPAFVALKGGHLVYLNRPALARLGIDRDTPDPPGGQIVRDAAGEPTGVLVDQAAWNAVRFVSSEIDPQTVAQAILAAQQRALRYGVTTIGDNTFYPVHMAQYLRLSEAGLLKLRVAARSFGSLPITHFLMKSIGTTPFGGRDSRVRYLGAKFFLDTSLSEAAVEGATPQSPGSAKGDSGEAGLTMTEDQLREAFLFAGPYGLAFHNQSRAGTERLLAVRASIAGRRDPRAVDIIDHCGACDGDLPARLRDSGFKVTLLPGQLHDLPTIARRLGDDATRRLLPIRELFQAGVRPVHSRPPVARIPPAPTLPPVRARPPVARMPPEPTIPPIAAVPPVATGPSWAPIVVPPCPPAPPIPMRTSALPVPPGLEVPSSGLATPSPDLSMVQANGHKSATANESQPVVLPIVLRLLSTASSTDLVHRRAHPRPLANGSIGCYFGRSDMQIQAANVHESVAEFLRQLFGHFGCLASPKFHPSWLTWPAKRPMTLRVPMLRTRSAKDLHAQLGYTRSSEPPWFAVGRLDGEHVFVDKQAVPLTSRSPRPGPI